jgi:hypothetical protein
MGHGYNSCFKVFDNSQNLGQLIYAHCLLREKQ